ncbi:MAG: V-type ATP synthase subunit F [Candidatus Promineifilaceae bacterium]
MSRLFIVTQPETVSGFHLAGVDAYAAENVPKARSQIEKWLAAGEQGLLAVEQTLFNQFDPAFQKRLLSGDQLPVVVLPDGNPVGPEKTGRQHIADLIRNAIGFHITFRD